MVALAVFAAGIAQSDELYRWTDDDGHVHYSDALPPEQAPDGRDIYDRAGRHLERIDAALSPEERALEREREEQEREARELAEKEAREQAEYDHMLRQTYTSVEEIRRARDERLENLESATELAEQRIRRYHETLERLREQAAELERATGGDPEPVHERIDEINGRIARQEAFIERREADIEDVRTTFGEHIQRVRELLAEDG